MSQIFQKNIPKTILFDFLQKYCDTNKNQYIFSNHYNKIDVYIKNLLNSETNKN